MPGDVKPTINEGGYTMTGPVPNYLLEVGNLLMVIRRQMEELKRSWKHMKPLERESRKAHIIAQAKNLYGTVKSHAINRGAQDEYTKNVHDAVDELPDDDEFAWLDEIGVIYFQSITYLEKWGFISTGQKLEPNFASQILEDADQQMAEVSYEEQRKPEGTHKPEEATKTAVERPKREDEKADALLKDMEGF